MVQFNVGAREIVLKIVYYGPALSGKTTNLKAIHALINERARGRLLTLDTKDDRTLFFDLLPVFFQTRSGFKVKLKLFTVPGQVIHNSTRRVVLQGADAVAFIADSQLKEAKANSESFKNLRKNLLANGLDPSTTPTVIQFNKRDLASIRTDEEIDVLRARSQNRIYKAIAIRGVGVIETLYGLLDETYASLNKKYDFQRKFGLTGAEFLQNIFKNLNVRPEQLRNTGV